MTEDILEKGILTARAGDLDQARILLATAARQNPGSAKAWYWLGQVLDEPEKKAFCFEKARQLDPGIFEGEKDRSTPEVTIQPSPALQTREEELTTAAKPYSLAMALLGAMAILLLIGITAELLVGSGLLGRITQGGSSPDPAVLAAHALSTSGTVTPPAILGPTFFQTVRPAVTATVTLDAQGRQKLVGPLINTANDKMNRQLYQDAIPLWDKIIAATPDYGEAYYQRGLAYYMVSVNLTDQSKEEHDLSQALADLDQAITYGPVNGNYFFRRGQVYWAMQANTPYRVDRQPLLETALENIRLGIGMGTTVEGAGRDIPLLLNDLGHCDQGLAEAKRLSDARSPKDPPDDELNYIMSLSYLCLGQFDNALTQINTAMEVHNYCNYFYTKAMILYSQNHLDEANKAISACIIASPSYDGYRYYLRALIEYDQGQSDQAKQDLEIGNHYSWNHEGLYAYLMGRLALDNSDKDQAITMFQYAEATMNEDDSPKIQNLIRSELATVGATPLSPTRSIVLHTTPLPPGTLNNAAANAPAPTPTPSGTPGSIPSPSPIGSTVQPVTATPSS